ncbi:sensor histidine kinase [Nocardioides sp. SYSU D00038]|uniref:sensor histidine kinase n=1 Tax=Nocardioides sp. SYSU D00038 TaxID=2812554 RepID=UPI00196898BB|nr:histidine kinase [Nocardioides sp. SYSU D00038]
MTRRSLLAGWSRRSQVERVDLYTRQSLYILLWLTVGFVVLQASAAERFDGWFVAVVASTTAVAASGTFVLRRVIDLYPALGPLPWRPLGPFLVLVATGLAVAALVPDDLHAAATTGVWGSTAWALGGLRDPRATAGVMALLTFAPWWGTGMAWTVAYGFLTGLFFLFTVRASLWLLGVVTELDRARGAQSALAVAEERLRFSRDVHDVLGRRLSTIAVQAELAATLAGRGDDGAAERMLEVRGVAHEALREARELARGYRATDLAQELEGARSLLRSAGIRVVLDVEDLPAAWHEAAGWVVREGVTNVLRHSDAAEVTIRWRAPELTVGNDRPTRTRTGDGAGLTGLRERLAPLGASLSAGGDAASYAVTATLPGTGPRDAT